MLKKVEKFAGVLCAPLYTPEKFVAMLCAQKKKLYPKEGEGNDFFWKIYTTDNIYNFSSFFIDLNNIVIWVGLKNFGWDNRQFIPGFCQISGVLFWQLLDIGPGLVFSYIVAGYSLSSTQGFARILNFISIHIYKRG